MTFFKICAFILFYFVTRAALANPLCSTYQGLNRTERICWNQSIKGWVSEICSNKSCRALKFFEEKKTISRSFATDGGKNPDAKVCHNLGHSVIILKDARQNEQSFCVFPDKSMVSTDAMGRFI